MVNTNLKGIVYQMNLLENLKLSTKTVIIISLLFIIVFVFFIGFTTVATGQVIRAGVIDELESMSKCNALQVQRFMDITQSTAYSMNHYIQNQYKREDSEVVNRPNYMSKIYNKPIKQTSFEIENYITESAKNAVISSPDILGVAVMFEPYKFDTDIEDYAFYCSESDRSDKIQPFGTYSHYSKEEYYAKAAKENEMVLTKPYQYGGSTIVTAASPIRYNNELKGVIMSDFNISNLSRLETKNERYPSLYTTIIDQDGVIIYDSQVLQNTGKELPQFYHQDIRNQISDKMKEGKMFSLTINDSQGQDKIGFFYPIKAGNSNWWSLIEVEKKDINVKIDATIASLVILFLLALIVTVIIVNTVLRKMLHPIQRVTEATVDITKGKFDFDLPISSKDEVGQLTSSFLKMAKKIEQVQYQLVKKNEQLEETIETLRQADAGKRAKNTFISNISHEFRTPITLILSVIQLFQANMGNCISKEKGNKYLNVMKQNCYRLLRLINNLIDISRVEAGYHHLDLKIVDVVKLSSDIVMSISQYALPKNINVKFTTDLEKMEVTIDQDKMERILLNLLSNSIKFTPEGGEVTINISKRDNAIVISVKDTGIGIPEDKKELIFDRFHQVDMSHTRMNEGSGIGLSLAKAFIEMLGGTIAVRSNLGKGSEFIIELPFRVFDHEKYSPQPFSMQEQSGNNLQRFAIEFSDIYYPLAN